MTTTEKLNLVRRVVKVAPTIRALSEVAIVVGSEVNGSACQFSEREHGKSDAALTAMSLVSEAEKRRKTDELIAVIETLESAQ